LWSDAKQQEETELAAEIVEKAKAIEDGGCKLLTAKQHAVDLRIARMKYVQLNSEVNSLDKHTAEAQAENARFNYLLTAALVYNDTKKPVYSGLDDYLNKANESYSLTAAEKYAYLTYNLDENYDDELVENKFLRDYGFADEQNRLINSDGHLIDTEGKLIDEFGYYVNDDGKRVNEDGEIFVETKFSAFLDEDGNPVAIPNKKGEEEKKASPAKPTKKKTKKAEAPAASE